MEKHSTPPRGLVVDASFPYHDLRQVVDTYMDTYIKAGLCPLHVEAGSKRATQKGWSQGIPAEETLREFERQDYRANVGVLLGPASAPSGLALVDIDLDSEEARTLAPRFLPATLTFGRAGSPRSHWLYYTASDVTRSPFAAPLTAHEMLEGKKQGQMLVEYRGARQQTVFPGSIHPTGESVRFDAPGAVTTVDSAKLERAVGHLAAAALLARAWPRTPGSRNDIVLALTGALLGDGWSEGDVERFVEAVAVAGDDEEGGERARSVALTKAKVERGEPVTGWTRLAEHLGRDAVSKAKAWLGSPGGLGPGGPATLDIDEVGDAVIRGGDASGVFHESVIRALAQASAAKYGSAKARLKAAFPTLNLNDLERAVKEVQANPPPPASADGRPVIVLDDRPPREHTAEAIQALADRNDPPRLFVRGGGLVRVRDDERGALRIEVAGPDIIRHELTAAADFLVPQKGGYRHVRPPKELVDDVAASGTWPVASLAGVSASPVVRPDGRIVAEPGYDAVTQVLYRAPDGIAVPPVPEAPTADDVARAKGLLDALLGDFSFEDQSSRANATALLLTPLLRSVIRGPLPGGLIEATKRGAGKTLLAQLVGAVVTGAPTALGALPERDEEVRKQVTATLLGGAPVAGFDNVRDRLDRPSLEALLTSRTWADRELGASRQVVLPNDTVWVFTGNNARVTSDLARRLVLVRLAPTTAAPWRRTDYRHPDLLDWALAHRGELLWALLVLTRSWFAAGQPKETGPPMGSFTAWCETVGGILAHASISGFLGNAGRLDDPGDEEAEWEAFLTVLWGWRMDQLFTAREVVDEIADAESTHGASLQQALPAELAAVAAREPERLNQALGVAFRAHEGARFGTEHFRVERGGSKRGNASTWRVTCTFGERMVCVDRQGASLKGRPPSRTGAKAPTNMPSPSGWAARGR